MNSHEQLRLRSVGRQCIQMHKAFILNNIMRTREMLDYAATGFKAVFQTVPFLFQVNKPGVPGYVDSPTPVLGIHGFDRSGFARLYVESHPEHSLKEVLVSDSKILSLALIGSTGSVGHNRMSDLDYWVTLDKSSLKPSEFRYLKEKTELIEQWAVRRHKTEVHFFLMDPVEIKTARFGALDEESSGEVMPRLVMEEFYRTMLYVAGRLPLWWATPPEFGPDEYEDLAANLKNIDLTTFHHLDFIDFGYPVPPKPSEYFGAAMWQAHKSQKDPFKALIKILLIKEQVENDFSLPLLCDLVKKEVLKAIPERMPVDPYYITIRRVLDYAREHLDLVRQAAWFKIQSPWENREPVPGGKKAKLLAELQKEWNWPDERVRDLIGYSRWRQVKRLALGEEFKAVLLDLFSEVAALLRKKYPNQMLLHDDNMALLNAQILARYADHSTRIEDLPSAFHRIGMPRDMNLVFEDGYWKLCETMSGGEDYFYSSVKLTRVAAWLVQNQLWTKGVRFRLRAGSRPVKSGAVIELLNILAAVFPPFTFNAYRNRGLMSRPTGPKVLVVNMDTLIRRDELIVVEVIYRTSLGEMFHEEINIPITASPAEKFTYVAQWVDANHDGPLIEIIPYVPQRYNREELADNLINSIRSLKKRRPHERHNRMPKAKLDMD